MLHPLMLRNYLCNNEGQYRDQKLQQELHPLMLRNYLCNPAIRPITASTIKLHPLMLRNYLCNRACNSLQQRGPGHPEGYPGLRAGTGVLLAALCL